jgi:hypothetical protein
MLPVSMIVWGLNGLGKPSGRMLAHRAFVLRIKPLRVLPLTLINRFRKDETMRALKREFHDDLERRRCARDGEYENEWIPALVAFYRVDCSFQRAESLSKGWTGLDGTDRRTIEAIKAAMAVAP